VYVNAFAVRYAIGKPAFLYIMGTAVLLRLAALAFVTRDLATWSRQPMSIDGGATAPV
jgi:hypothetical protein